MSEDVEIGQHFLDNAVQRFRTDQALGRKAIEQVSNEADLWHALDAESNSIGIVVRHMVGNMRSRWTDFLTTDGEKPDRNRDGEFELESELGRDDLLRSYEAGWKHVYAAVEALKPSDLLLVVTIREEPHTVLEAITRQLTHYAYHVGQIVFLAKHFQSDAWKSLSVPRKR